MPLKKKKCWVPQRTFHETVLKITFFFLSVKNKFSLIISNYLLIDKFSISLII